MRIRSFSGIAAAFGMTIAAVAFGAPQSRAWGTTPAPLAGVVGSNGSVFVCDTHAARKVPLTARLPYLTRLRQEEPVEQILRIRILPDGSVRGTNYVVSEDACTLDVNGKVELDPKTGVGTAQFDLSALKKKSELRGLPCSVFFGNRQTFGEDFTVVTDASSLGAVRLQLLGLIGFNPKFPVPVEGTCTRQAGF